MQTTVPCLPPQQENDRGDDKIRQLIATLDLRKDEAIERTFKGVAKQFRDVFAQVRAAWQSRT
jgi:structural maintenance of chromosome 3 (chondroitin sulfate proteoglycan 6)